MNSNFLVSVITVSFNSEKTIKDTIESVLNQSYPNIEYIIIDGKSKDRTLEIIKSYEDSFSEKSIPYVYLSEPDEGIYHAMNKGLKMVKGELIGILNSDDWYEPDAIFEIFMTNNNNLFSVISGKKNKVSFDKKILKTIQNKKNIENHIFKTMPLNHPATFVHKNVYNEIGFFNKKYKLSADYDLIYRAFNASANFLFSDEVIVNMRNTGSTHQLKNLSITAAEDYEIRKVNNVKWAYFFYLKKLAFNSLIIIRDIFRKAVNTF